MNSTALLERYERLRHMAALVRSSEPTRSAELIAAALAELGAGETELATDRSRRMAHLPPSSDLDSWSVAYIDGLVENEERSGRARYDPDTAFAGYSPKVLAIRADLWRLANAAVPVLFVGERGSGKGQLMRAVHAMYSDRYKNRKLLTVPLAAISPQLAESELFGHEKGAFTDAGRKRKGAFQVVHDEGGVLYLDDIGECPLEIQSKLLTVLDDGVIHPVGADETISLGRGENRRFKVYASTQPEALSKIRPDLRDRLATLIVRIPPLRERCLDVLLLADALTYRLSRQRQRLSRRARAALLDFHWPGNVRELHNVVNRAVVLSDGHPVIGRDVMMTSLADEEYLGSYDSSSAERQDIPDPRAHSFSERGRFLTLAEAEANHIREALVRTNGNVSRAASLLNVPRTTLQGRMKKAGIANKRRADADTELYLRESDGR